MAVKNPYNGYSPKERDAKYKVLNKHKMRSIQNDKI